MISWVKKQLHRVLDAMAGDRDPRTSYTMHELESPEGRASRLSMINHYETRDRQKGTGP